VIAIYEFTLPALYERAEATIVVQQSLRERGAAARKDQAADGALAYGVAPPARLPASLRPRLRRT
jgi:hypothetical protein